MPRYALLVEFDGAPFVGWQRQPSGPSVQQVLEEAAAPLNQGLPAATQAAGRTDSGVHAEGMVVQIDIAQDLDPVRLREALNYHTRPHPVSVLGVAVPPAEWSARFSCIGRAYRYRILNRRPRPALQAGRVWHVGPALDAAAMHAAAQGLLGRHDFSAFRAASCQAKSALRTLDRLDVSRQGEEVVIHTAARSFLHHQVRNMVGTLAQVGLGRQGVDWPRRLLEARERNQAGQTAPAEGLTFLQARYPEPLDWR
ncbi:tRNA pseudouridine(38-40) synthase TruA [Pseudoroseomonas cervicalis]|uniref:tRNA pseudouridine(38-40) synthase TruA n=1 Tax=Teichococcus cervicalis TaxID=204525 RepID=UPI0022F16F55|nr:tRNA pseudouridine(38-40) synthase TruA [Pseudoroseomonas cervicalis]WBV41626.1 tRNA pseudouridine(38-40) synthase TruA [Pseudoroseomonas cervicalis]